MISVGALHRWSLCSSVVLAAWSVTSGSGLLLGAAVALVATVCVEARHLYATERSPRRRWLVHAATAVGLVFSLATLRQAQIDAVLLIVFLGIFNRFVLRGGHRDDFLLIGASAVVVAVATTIMPGVLYLALAVAYVPAVLWALWSGQILAAAEDGEADPGRRREIAARMRARPVGLSLAFVALIGNLLTLGAFVALLALPRYQFSQLLAPGYFMPMPGGGDSMELHTNGVVSAAESGAVVLRVEPGAKGGSAEVAGLYARLWVLDEFDGREFKASESSALFPVLPAPEGRARRAEAAVREDEPPELTATDPPGTVRVTLNRLTRDAMHPVAAIGRQGPTEIRRRGIRQTASGTWTFGRVTTANIIYKAHLDRPVHPLPLPRPMATALEEKLTQLPEGLDPRVVELGRTLTAGAATTGEKVSAVLRYLSVGFRYSLDRLNGHAADPLARFLFEAKEGHCELYAAALAVLLRAGGVKARVATGYYGGTWNALGGYLAFTSQDAHAWVEVYDEATGWRWVDATPEDLRAVRRRAPLAFLRDWYDAAEALWFDQVVDFDERRRRLFMAKLESGARALETDFLGVFGKSGDGIAEPARDGRPRIRSGLAAAGGLGALVALGVVAGVRRRRRPPRPEALGRRLRRALGARAEENVTLGTLVERTPAELRSSAIQTVMLYETMRFGPDEGAPNPEDVSKAVRALERQARKSSPSRSPRQSE